MDSWLGVGDSRWTLTNAPGMGGLQGRNRGWPSSKNPVNLLQIGLLPKSGLLLPTRTTIVAGLLAPGGQKSGSYCEVDTSFEFPKIFYLHFQDKHKDKKGFLFGTITNSFK